MGETWRPVVGLEGEYEVSDEGRCYSLPRSKTKSNGVRLTLQGQLLRTYRFSNDYRAVTLTYPTGRVSRTLHTLVLEAFVGPRPEGMVGCHWDGDPTNNVLSNLRWDTPSANGCDTLRHGRNQQANYTLCSRGHGLREPNLEPTKAANSWRQCRACQYGRGWAAPRGRLNDEPYVQYVSDSYYWKILEKGPKIPGQRYRLVVGTWRPDIDFTESLEHVGP